jgi:hypothetical protein
MDPYDNYNTSEHIIVGSAEYMPTYARYEDFSERLGKLLGDLDEYDVHGNSEENIQLDDMLESISGDVEGIQLDDMLESTSGDVENIQLDDMLETSGDVEGVQTDELLITKDTTEPSLLDDALIETKEDVKEIHGDKDVDEGISLNDCLVDVNGSADPNPLPINTLHAIGYLDPRHSDESNVNIEQDNVKDEVTKDNNISIQEIAQQTNNSAALFS